MRESHSQNDDLEESDTDHEADDAGNVFAGLTQGCAESPSGGCLQKWVKK